MKPIIPNSQASQQLRWQRKMARQKRCGQCGASCRRKKCKKCKRKNSRARADWRARKPMDTPEKRTVRPMKPMSRENSKIMDKKLPFAERSPTAGMTPDEVRTMLLRNGATYPANAGHKTTAKEAAEMKRRPDRRKDGAK